MRLDISAEAGSALQVILSEVQNLNQYADKRLGHLASACIVMFCQSVSKNDLHKLSNQLMTRKGRRKAVMDRLSALADNFQTLDFELLEKAMAKASSKARPREELQEESKSHG